MNLRILKKLSKKALPLADRAGLLKGQTCFPAEPGDSYTGMRGFDRKHWQRWPAPHPTGFRGVIYKMNKAGTCHIAMSEPSEPLKGTPMVGGLSGYYEPEWDEETVWELLTKWIYCVCTDWSGDSPRPTFIAKNPTQVFEKAKEIIANQEAE